MEKLENILFDTQDQELFLVDDLHLKANAIRHSILPKLNLVVQYAIAKINKVYEINVFEDCMIAQAPHFRLHDRPADIKKNYQYARVSIKGKRTANKWHGIKKPNGDEPKIVPFSFGLELSHQGLFVSLKNSKPPISEYSHKKVFDFLKKYDSSVNQIQKCTRVFDRNSIKRAKWSIRDRDYSLDNLLKTKEYDYQFISDCFDYPVTHKTLFDIIDRLALLFPIFHSYIQVAKGEEVRFDNLIEKANKWLLEDAGDLKIDNSEEKTSIDMDGVILKAATKIKILSGIRWQVFKRDNWRCVSCGLTSDDGIILHVDHINPKSKGGKNEIENYQTLCDRCNIGKSNKDNTNIKASRIAMLEYN